MTKIYSYLNDMKQVVDIAKRNFKNHIMNSKWTF